MQPIHLITALSAAALWGIVPIFHKSILAAIEPTTLLAITFSLPALLVFPYILFQRHTFMKDVRKLTPTLWFLAIFALPITLLLANLLYLRVLKHLPSHVATPLTYSSPLFTLILAALFLREPITLQATMGVLLIVAGVITLGLSHA